MPLPLKITPCPILNTLVELRYNPSVPEEAVFGVLYTQLSAQFPQSEKQAILQLPAAIRDVNPKLRFQPHYRLRSEGYVISIGPKVFSLGLEGEYPGWAAFREKVLSVYGSVVLAGIIKQPLRLGLRYINILSPSAFADLTLQVSLAGTPLDGNRTFFRTILKREQNNLTVQVGKDVTAKHSRENKTGTLVDIDVFQSPTGALSMEEMGEFIDSAHDSEKSLFFEILGPKVLQGLNPTY